MSICQVVWKCKVWIKYECGRGKKWIYCESKSWLPFVKTAPTECFDVTGEWFKFEKWPSRQHQNNESFVFHKMASSEDSCRQQSSRLRVTTSWSHVIPSRWRKTPLLTRSHIKARLQFVHVPLCECEWVWGSFAFSLRRLEWDCLGTWRSFFGSVPERCLWPCKHSNHR